MDQWDKARAEFVRIVSKTLVRRQAISNSSRVCEDRKQDTCKEANNKQLEQSLLGL